MICRDDTVARGVLQVLHERGIAVPGRMTVTGFGDVSGSTEENALTTVQIDAHTMGMLAVNVMLNRLRVPAMMPVTAVIHAPLCIRATSGPPPRTTTR
jgi:LacI family transcriptional regulator